MQKNKKRRCPFDKGNGAFCLRLKKWGKYSHSAETTSFLPQLGKKSERRRRNRRELVKIICFKKGHRSRNGAVSFSRSTKNKRFHHELLSEGAAFCEKAIL